MRAAGRAKEQDIYDLVMIGLTMGREKLYRRIEERVDKMIAEDLTEEVKMLLAQDPPPSPTAMQGLGYRQIAAFLMGEYPLATAIELIKRDTRRFAKRQHTWFKRDEKINWFNIDNYQNGPYPAQEKLARDVLQCIRRGFEEE
jgi:tRNA dimethylallyltransferase